MYKLIGVVTLGLVFCLAGCGKTGTDTNPKPKEKPAATRSGCKCEKGKEGTRKDCKCAEKKCTKCPEGKCTCKKACTKCPEGECTCKKEEAKCCGCGKKGEKAPAPEKKE